MRVKICGITRGEDALHAVSAGAWAIGVVTCSDSRRTIPLSRAEEIFRSIEGTALTVAVTHSKDIEEIERILSLAPDAIQISHPHRVKDADPLIFRVIKRGDPVPDDCDAIVLDESMGRGRLLDIRYARELVERSPVPVILAGGLNPSNVGEIIRLVRPYAVDVASGVEISPGIKDRSRVRAFLEACRSCSA